MEIFYVSMKAHNKLQNIRLHNNLCAFPFFQKWIINCPLRVCICILTNSQIEKSYSS